MTTRLARVDRNNYWIRTADEAEIAWGTGDPFDLPVMLRKSFPNVAQQVNSSLNNRKLRDEQNTKSV